MRFIVDNNVGKLATWLRALGCDALFINPIEDSELIAISRREARVILTKDRGILRRRLVTSGEIDALLIEGDDWRDQLRQVIQHFGLPSSPRFTRCVECNATLEPRTRESARAHVPPYVHRTHETFLACPTCGRHYWKGTHRERMRQELERILAVSQI
jgi:uncharacterized protein with PIN domain